LFRATPRTPKVSGRFQLGEVEVVEAEAFWRRKPAYFARRLHGNRHQKNAANHWELENRGHAKLIVPTKTRLCGLRASPTNVQHLIDINASCIHAVQAIEGVFEDPEPPEYLGHSTVGVAE
jgi:hypothetical protein